jgi:hypothetical protein
MHIDAIGHRFVVRQLIEDAGDLHGNARAHQHVIDARQHRAVQRGEVRQLHLLEQVDAHQSGVSCLREIHLGEVAQHDQLEQCRWHLDRRYRLRLVCRACCLAALDVMSFPDSSCDFGDRKCIEGDTQVTARIAHLQAPCDDGVDTRARDDAELTSQRDRSRESPRRDGHSHAALDDPG